MPLSVGKTRTDWVGIDVGSEGAERAVLDGKDSVQRQRRTLLGVWKRRFKRRSIKYSAQQVPPAPTLRTASEEVVRFVANALDKVVRAGLGKMLVACCHERS